MKKILAIIPARGGSKRLKNKNLRLLNKKPLIYWTILNALKTKKIHRIICSTDNKKIANYCKKFNIEVPFIRSKKLSGNKIKTEDVVLNTLNFLEKKEGFKPDVILILQPTSPLRTYYHINQSINEFYNNKLKHLISVKKLNRNIFIKTNDNSIIRKNNNTFYSVNGAIYLISVNYFLKNKTLVGTKKINYYEMNEVSSIDIDTVNDLKKAECFFKAN